MNPKTLVHEGKVLSLFYVGPEEDGGRSRAELQEAMA